MFRAGDAVAVGQIEHGVKDRIVIGNIDERAVREHVFHPLHEDFPLFGAVKIVGHEESSAQEVIAQYLSLFRA